MKVSIRRMYFTCLVACVVLSLVLCSFPAFSYRLAEHDPDAWHQKLTDYNEYVLENGDFMVYPEPANVYGHPWTKSPILAVLYSKTQVTLLGSYDDDWLQVSIGAITGWMRTDDLIDFGQTGGWAGVSLGNTYCRVQPNNPSSKVNLHPLPYVDSGDLGSYAKGRLVWVMGHTVNREWYLVSVSGDDGFTGFMSASKLGEMHVDDGGPLS